MTPESLASIIGEDATFALLALRAGARLYVPTAPTARFIEECGGDEKAAAKLCDEFGRMFIVIPVGRPWRIRKMSERGFSIREITLAMACKRDTVMKHMPETQGGHEAKGPKAA